MPRLTDDVLRPDTYRWTATLSGCLSLLGTAQRKQTMKTSARFGGRGSCVPERACSCLMARPSSVFSSRSCVPARERRSADAQTIGNECDRTERRACCISAEESGSARRTSRGDGRRVPLPLCGLGGGGCAVRAASAAPALREGGASMGLRASKARDSAAKARFWEEAGTPRRSRGREGNAGELVRSAKGAAQPLDDEGRSADGQQAHHAGTTAECGAVERVRAPMQQLTTRAAKCKRKKVERGRSEVARRKLHLAFTSALRAPPEASPWTHGLCLWRTITPCNPACVGANKNECSARGTTTNSANASARSSGPKYAPRGRSSGRHVATMDDGRRGAHTIMSFAFTSAPSSARSFTTDSCWPLAA